ncbi:HAMP domain-containing histidine kinase [Shimia sp. R10_1]|uniref:sensor histidine kinase n=1 Tax=Shimia sp. R10_1 TaxID=2821095 RepID=UPI001AD9A3D5|nr:HAMP domain-containing sensor histidine kinase [Shimia sp. R10_1]MBO9475729.1 HAMP domain-containing histidine kinase [Shimia sp. R10_1]
MSSNRFKRFLGQSSIRQAAALLTVFGVVSTLTWSVTYWMVRNEIERLVDARLQTQTQSVVDAIENGAPLPSPGFGQSIALLKDGQISAGNIPFTFDTANAIEGYFEYDFGDPTEPDYRFLVKDTPVGRLIVAENIERQDELFDVLATGLRIALLSSLSAVILTGLLIARRNQIRLDAISDGLTKVAQGDLTTRINLPDRHDDLSLMANWTDTTTARLQRSMEQIRVQSANIAHDLRTPLARLRAVIEHHHEALLNGATPVTPEALEDALAQVDRIVATFDALLRIARIESGARRASFAPVNLQSLVRSFEEIFEPVVSESGQSLNVSITHPTEIFGDEELLLQLIANLLQNALRYGKTGQTIALTVDGTRITIADQGPGIPADKRQKVFDPLYQLEAHRQNEGFGLGLPLVQAIVELHDAQLSMSDGPNGVGLSISIKFPKLTNL